jgi:3',5'-nucleoside bisphosphate phosphatase
MPVDLHLHSTASDGADSPAALMDLAAAEGVTTAALTDHDTLAGITQASERAVELGIRLIPGIELSVDHGGAKLHMLVYFTEPGRGPLNDRLEGLLRGRDERNRTIVSRLNTLGYEIALTDVLARAGGPSVGRPHIADALIEAGYFESRNEAFEHLLHDGGPAYVERARLTAIEAIHLAREQDAVAVVAHPATIALDTEGYSRLFRELADAGLGGIEAHHSMHHPDLREHLTELAHSLGLAATGGSDYHGIDTRTYRIRTGNGDLRIPDHVVDELDAARER